MLNEDRKIFWNLLETAEDSSMDTLLKLGKATITPKVLCRFRSVNESTLLQLQENKMYFSNANYYDDPFDTYFKIDYQKLENIYNFLKGSLDSGDIALFENALETIGFKKEITGDISLLKDSKINMPELKSNLSEIRKKVQNRQQSICFCEDPLNETTWLKYADNHKGFVQIYDFSDKQYRLCGVEEKCKKCPMNDFYLYPLPVYYSNKKYDGTLFALTLLINQELCDNITQLPQYLQSLIFQASIWELEKTSLIKKKCHEYDGEWRLINPYANTERTYIKYRPKYIIIGLRTPQYEQRLIIEAAKIAGVENIYKIYINDENNLDFEQIKE